MEKTCPCGVLFFCKKYLLLRKKYCSKKCFYKFRFVPIWNKGLKGIHLSPQTEFKKGFTPWNKGIPVPDEQKKRQAAKLSGRRVSPATEFKKGLEPWNKGKAHLGDEKHPQWKGEKVGYSALHTWIHRKVGKAARCDFKGCKYPRRNAANKVLLSPKGFQWANISHEYRRELSDWIQLCHSCHARYDRGLLEL